MLALDSRACAFDHGVKSPREHVRLLDDFEIERRARDGDVDALRCWAHTIDPVDYDELGWGD